MHQLCSLRSTQDPINEWNHSVSQWQGTALMTNGWELSRTPRNSGGKDKCIHECILGHYRKSNNRLAIDQPSDQNDTLRKTCGYLGHSRANIPVSYILHVYKNPSLEACQQFSFTFLRANFMFLHIGRSGMSSLKKSFKTLSQNVHVNTHKHLWSVLEIK